jgi:Protein of unknown function (DUF3276)
MMEEGMEKNEVVARTENEEIFSKAVRAGKRTYFFDVKATRRNDYYLTLTESKKRFNRDGRFYFEKHKIFLYKEDFDKFWEGLSEAIEFIKNAKPELIDYPGPVSDKDLDEKSDAEGAVADEVADRVVDEEDEENQKGISDKFSDVEFEDLEEKKGKSK